MLTPETLPHLQRLIAEAGVDGWLLFDFHGVNPIAGGLLRLDGMVTRRIFAWVPRDGVPVAITHAIEQGPWRHWPEEWGRERYSGWCALERALREAVDGRTVAMEYSPGDAVPYVDRVPAGVLEMVRAAGATVVSSGELVSRFYAVWTPEQLGSHRRAAKEISAIARGAFRHAAEQARKGSPVHEHELQQIILTAFERQGLETDHGPIVAVGPNAADPHYAPSADRPVPIRDGDLVLIDLWAREREGGIYADQTWMASLGTPSARTLEVWDAVRAARDAALILITQRMQRSEPVLGAEADDAARQVIAERGFADYFTHRTGHSIDAHDLHGSGPHLDNLETREERRLLPGVGFSVEPGIYIPGEIGVRSEVNGFVAEGTLVITPEDYQRELLVL